MHNKCPKCGSDQYIHQFGAGGCTLLREKGGTHYGCGNCRMLWSDEDIAQLALGTMRNQYEEKSDGNV